MSDDIKMPKGGWRYGKAAHDAFEKQGLTFGFQRGLDLQDAVKEQKARIQDISRQQSAYLPEVPAHPNYLGLQDETLRLGKMQESFRFKPAQDMTGWKGFLARRIVNTGNLVNSHLKNQGRGHIAGGFTTVGQVMAAAPLKRFATGYGMGLPIMGIMEFGLQGKPMTIGNVAGMAFDNIAFTIGSELAGVGWKGMAKYTGWQMLGEEMGLGTWGSLGMQAVGMKLPGLGWGITAAVAGYKAGKGVFQLGHSMYELGQKSRRTSFDTGDMSWSTGEAATMRQRSLGAIQNSHLNLRSILGNEAQLLSMTR